MTKTIETHCKKGTKRLLSMGCEILKLKVTDAFKTELKF